MAEAVFWGALGVVAYVYVGYPCLLFVLARLRPRPVRREEGYRPTVSFIIAAYNEEAAIADKLRNTFAFDYPKDRLEVIVVSDGSTDRTEEIVRKEFPQVKLLPLGGRFGKTIGQNRAVEIATGEILAFSDATTVYYPNTLRKMVRNFADPSVGLVGGTMIHGTEIGAAVDEGRNMYWNYERFLRTHESMFHSILGASGCVYAMRRELYNVLPADMISDVAQACKTVQRGYRSVVEDEANVYEPAESKSIPEEIQRRARVITRGLRGKWAMRDFFHPLRHPWFCIQVLSHRVLRWAVQFFLMIAFAANLFLLDQPLYQVLFLAQAALYGAAVLGYVLERRGIRPKPLLVPLYFCVINLAPIVAVRALLRGERKVVWETNRV